MCFDFSTIRERQEENENYYYIATKGRVEQLGKSPRWGTSVQTRQTLQTRRSTCPPRGSVTQCFTRDAVHESTGESTTATGCGGCAGAGRLRVEGRQKVCLREVESLFEG